MFRPASASASASASAPRGCPPAPDATRLAQGRYATWYRKHRLQAHKDHHRSEVRPALARLGMGKDEWVDLSLRLQTIGNAGDVETLALAAWDVMVAAVPPRVAAYLRTRRAVFAKMYNRAYRAKRSQHRVHFVAHNSAGFDSCALLDHL